MLYNQVKIVNIWNPVRNRSRLTPTVTWTKKVRPRDGHPLEQSEKELSEEEAEPGYNTFRRSLWEEVDLHR